VSNNSSSLAVFITCYNEEAYIKDCLDSINNSSHPPTCVYIFDNCSTDSTKSICSNYNFKCSKKYFKSRESNIGSLNNYLRALTEINEEFVLFVGAHDLIAPTFIEQALKRINSSKSIGLVYSHVNHIDQNGIYLRSTGGGNFENSERRGIESLIYLLSQRINECTAIHGIYRKEVIKKYTFHVKFSPDLLTLLSISMNYEISRLETFLYTRRHFLRRQENYYQRLTGLKSISLTYLFWSRAKFIYHLFSLYFASRSDDVFKKIKNFVRFCSAIEMSFGIFSLRTLRNNIFK
jgi:glycosyltransferase involved in cell wall biosynthesis